MLRNSLIIGQAPARSADPEQRAWDSASGRRLAKMMGTELGQVLSTFDTCNLNTQLHGTNGKWDRFDLEEARKMAEYLERSILWQYDVVLICGQAVARCFDAKTLSHEVRRYEVPSGKWEVTATHLYAIPHPGGTNMWWNSPENRKLGTAYARRAWQHAEKARRAAQGLTVAHELPTARGGHVRHRMGA